MNTSFSKKKDINSIQNELMMFFGGCRTNVRIIDLYLERAEKEPEIRKVLTAQLQSFISSIDVMKARANDVLVILKGMEPVTAKVKTEDRLDTASQYDEGEIFVDGLEGLKDVGNIEDLLDLSSAGNKNKRSSKQTVKEATH